MGITAQSNYVSPNSPEGLARRQGITVTFTRMSDGSWGLKADSSLAGRECVWVTKASGEVSVVDVGESVFESIEERIYVYWIVAEKPVPTDIADMSYAQFKVARAAAKRAAKKNAK